ncbi:hypothetical protein AGMMS50276_13050 [Synergistales bacterium]|nr:hypothetical protein AGMMS50276_13050 [Synergistales bacterium]
MWRILKKTAVLFLFGILLMIHQVGSALGAETTVGVAQGTDYTGVTALAISNAGGLTGIVKKGDTVLLKPNLCTPDFIDSPLTTDYRVTAEIVRQVKTLGAGRVIIAEGPFDENPFTPEMLKASAYGTIEGVEFLHLNDLGAEDCYHVTGKNTVTKKPIYIPKIYVDADVVITVAKLKTHEGTVVSLGLKNAIGVPPMPLYNRPRAKLALHMEYKLTEAIVEINLIRTPDFTVIDGIVGGERENSRKANPVRANTIIAGRDIVAVDAVSSALMGFDPKVVPHIMLAARTGMGTMDLDKIAVVGGKIEDMAIDFTSPFPKK